MKKSTSLLLLAVATSLLLFACKKKPEIDFSPEKNFDALWEILDTKYCYFNARNLDWDGVYKTYKPKLKSVKDELSLFHLLSQMLDTLQDGHVNLYTPFDISRCTGWFDKYPANFNNELIYGKRYLGSNYKIAGGFHYNLIDGGEVGYIRYKSFMEGFSAENLRYIDRIFKNCKGIIIDVRNNGGGYIHLSKSFASCFFKEETLVGYIQHKTGNGHNDFSKPQAVRINPSGALIDWSDRKIAILVNRRCYSATNDFIATARYGKNVKIIGGITGGGGGLPLSSELPCGWMIRFSAVPMFDAEMKHTEFGIYPDNAVSQKATDDASGADTLIETAINLLKKQ